MNEFNDALPLPLVVNTLRRVNSGERDLANQQFLIRIALDGSQTSPFWLLNKPWMETADDIE